MSRVTTLRGAPVYLEAAHDVPLVWFRVAAHGGSATDPIGREGLTRHAGQLARRGAGERDREAIDRELDEMGASLDVSTTRDSVGLSGLCLARHVEQTVAIAADIMARPAMDRGEHDKLLRESRAALDELRDDDSEIADRFFNREVAPDTPYARTVIGTESTLAGLGLDEARDHYRAQMVPGNLVVGFAGDIQPDAAVDAAARLLTDLADRQAPAPVPLVMGAVDRPRRLVLVDKPGRMQAQIRLGHPTPAYGDDDFRALTLAEVAFGGSFSSRLMQAVRVERGWSYGAGCSLGRTRGPHWLRISLAPSAEVAAEATSLVTAMFEELTRSGISADELDFARSHVLGSMPFYQATAGQRMRLAVRNRIFGLADDFDDQLARQLSAVTLEQVNAAIRRHFHPDALTTVVVGSAEQLAKELEGRNFGTVATCAHDSY